MSRTYQQKLDQLDDLRRFECLSEAEYRRLKQELLVTEGPPAIEKRPGFTGLGIATAHGPIRVEPTTAANCPHCGRIIEGIHLCTNYTAPEKGSLVALWDRELQAARKRIDEVWSSGDYIYRMVALVHGSARRGVRRTCERLAESRWPDRLSLHRG
jgi:hypothetical protein